jgi:RHS repeat-associated protein
MSRLTGLVDQGAGTFFYTYDAVGNRMTASANAYTSWSRAYTYDNIYQLTGVAQTGGGYNGNESYTYDAVGNRMSSLNVPSYTVDSSNRLTAKTGATYTYDNNGNTLTKTDSTGTTMYTWDFENRLASATKPGSSTVTFKYDPFGRRIEKNTQTYVYDGANLIEDLNSAGTMTSTYVYGQRVDDLLESAGRFVFQDGLGSIIQTEKVTSKPQVWDVFNYDSFGNSTASPAYNLDNLRFQYTGRENDSETGLYYYRARYYDPATGRFLSEDPIGFSGGTEFYAYVRSNPANWTDPSGLKPGDKYDSAKVAALQALIDILPTSLQEGVEYAGRIYQNRDGSFSYTVPRKGENNPPRSYPGSCPWFTKPAGNYHTHPNIPGYDSEDFSLNDLLKDNLNLDTGYLGTASGLVLMHEAHKDTITIGRIPTQRRRQ